MSLKTIIQSIKQMFGSRQKAVPMYGTIKFFDRKKRFGFIIAGKNEYFFHAAATKPADFNDLAQGVKVQFHLIQGKRGPQANNIQLI